MAMNTGTITVRSRIYNMTGVAVTNMDPSAGVDLGLVSDLVLPTFERDVQIYRDLRYGSTPANASIDGSGCILEFGLSEYDAAAVTFLTQRIQRTATTVNWEGAMVGSYVLGKLLSSSELLRLLVADETSPLTNPMLLIPKAVVVKVSNIALSKTVRMMDPASIQVIGLHDATNGGPFAFGDYTKFAEYSA